MSHCIPRLSFPVLFFLSFAACGGTEGSPNQNSEGNGNMDGVCPAGTFLDAALPESGCVDCAVGEYCAGGVSGPEACQEKGLEDHDSNPSTPCEDTGALDDACNPGASAIGGECKPCVSGQYCPGGTVPATECPAGTVDDDDDPASACAQCSVGTYCPGGVETAASCGEATWDDDSDPATPCKPKTQCARNETTSTPTGNADVVCSTCPANTMPTAPGGSTCDLFSVDPETPVPTYTVTVHGALLAPFEADGEEWDPYWYLPVTWNVLGQEDIDDVHLVGTSGDFAAATTMLDTYGSVTLPDVYGDVRLSVPGFSEVYTVLNSRNNEKETLRPEWSGRGFANVPISDGVRMLVSLYDSDPVVDLPFGTAIGSDDPIAYAMLTGTQLAEAANYEGAVARRVWEDGANRMMWLILEVTPEPGNAANAAPRAQGDETSSALSAFEPPLDKKRTLWVHGLDFWGGSSVILPYRSASYWTDQVPSLRGPNPIAVNYHGQARLSLSNVVLQYELDSYCTGLSQCYIACHSAGCAHTGYALARHSSLGSRWNVLGVAAAGSAAGGSELATLSKFVSIGGDLTEDLVVPTMRASYDHSALGVEVACMAGASAWGLTGALGAAAFLPGEDDGLVAYHSAGGVVDSAGGPYGSDFGNPGGTSAYELPLGYDERDYLFNGHWVFFRDDDVDYNHSGVKAKLATYMEFFE